MPLIRITSSLRAKRGNPVLCSLTLAGLWGLPRRFAPRNDDPYILQDALARSFENLDHSPLAVRAYLKLIEAEQEVFAGVY